MSKNVGSHHGYFQKWNSELKLSHGRYMCQVKYGGSHIIELTKCIIFVGCVMLHDCCVVWFGCALRCRNDWCWRQTMTMENKKETEKTSSWKDQGLIIIKSQSFRLFDYFTQIQLVRRIFIAASWAPGGSWRETAKLKRTDHWSRSLRANGKFIFVVTGRERDR